MAKTSQRNRKGLFVKHENNVLELLDTAGRPLRNLLFKITLSEDTADDLMQELFLRLSTSHAFAHSKNGFAYAWRTAVNLAIDHARRSRPAVPYDEQQTPGRPQARQPLEKLIGDEQFRRILGQLAKIKPPGRDIVLMRYLEQRDYSDIARRLGKNENYIRSQLSKTLTRLRQNLNGQLNM